MNISKEQAAKIIANTKGATFSVDFIKRTTGEQRTMLARTGVKKGVTGAGRKFDPASKGLVGVYEMTRGQDGRFAQGQFRMIALEGLRRLTCSGTTYQVN